MRNSGGFYLLGIYLSNMFTGRKGGGAQEMGKSK